MDLLRSLGRSPTLGLSQDQRRTLRRTALRVLLASLALSAAMGLAALARGEFDELDGRLLLSAFTVFGASAVALACGLAWERGRLGVVPPLGVALGLVGLVLLIVLIWTELGADSDLVWRAFVTETVFAVAATHASLVAISGSLRRLRGAPFPAYALNVVGVALTLLLVWADDVAGSGGFWRWYGAVMVLLIAATIALPVLRRLVGEPSEAPAPEAATPRARFCPACGEALVPAGASSCAACGANFEVRLTPP